MKSYEVLRDAIKPQGAKSVASDMRLSTSLIYKWCQESEGDDAAGADNPLDRLERLIEITDNRAPVEWLCEKAGGFFVENPPKDPHPPRMPVIQATRSLLNEFSEMLSAVSDSFEGDQIIDDAEALAIRKEWEDLKRTAESFVTACEEGVYGHAK